jgi:predicted nucleic acid-binding protein
MSDSSKDEGKSGLSMNELKLEVAVARDELAETLDALERKLNVPAKAKHTWRSIKRQYREDPGPILATAGLTAATIVTSIVLIFRRGRG